MVDTSKDKEDEISAQYTAYHKRIKAQEASLKEYIQGISE